MATRFQATPRGPQWAVEPRRRWREPLGGVLWLLMLLCAGVADVRW